MYFVYLLLCKDGSIYTGITNDVNRRFLVHKAGKGGRYTKSHRVIKILHTESYPTKSAALKREIEIKSLSKEEKVRLIKNGDIRSALARLKKPK